MDGLEYFHMVDFASCRKQFRTGWREDEPRRRSLYSDLIGIINSHVYRQFASVIESDQFGKLSPENRKEYSLNSYVLACRTCAAEITRWKTREGLDHVPTGFAFEDGDIGRGMLTKRFLEDGYPEPTFLPKRDTARSDGTMINGYTPLQAADILAYELHKPYRDILSGKPQTEKFRWGFEQLSKIPGVPGYYSPKNLDELGRKLEALTAERNSD